MTIYAENNKKTENIKASLGVHLTKLENRKQKIATRKNLISILTIR